MSEVKSTNSRISDALDVLCGLILETGQPWGQAACDFQLEDARHVLAPVSLTAGGAPAPRKSRAGQACRAPYSFLTRSRGSSKTSDLAAFIVTILLTQLHAGEKAYGVASDRDQARLLHDAAVGFIQRTPGLLAEFKVDAWKITCLRTGAIFEVLSADAPGAWGLRGHFFVLDEIAMWPSTPGARQLFEAVTTAAAKIDTARMVLLSTAGSPTHWSYKVRAHALKDPLWRVHEVPGPAPWMDKERLAEQERRLPESSNRRLFHNEWVESEDMLTTASDLEAAVTLDGPQVSVIGRSYVVGLDVGLKNDRTVASVCHAEPFEDEREGQRVVLDRIAVWQGSRTDPVKLSDVEAWLRQASKSYNNASVIFDPWQAAGTMQRLRAQNLSVQEFTFSSASVGKLAVGLHNALRNRQLALPRDEDLLDELANVRIRETSPNVYRLDHDEGAHDDRAISLALCVQALLHKPAVNFGAVKVLEVEPNVSGGWRSEIGGAWDSPTMAW